MVRGSRLKLRFHKDRAAILSVYSRNKKPGFGTERSSATELVILTPNQTYLNRRHAAGTDASYESACDLKSMLFHYSVGNCLHQFPSGREAKSMLICKRYKHDAYFGGSIFTPVMALQTNSPETSYSPFLSSYDASRTFALAYWISQFHFSSLIRTFVPRAIQLRAQLPPRFPQRL